MGRATFELIGTPQPGRHHIIIAGNPTRSGKGVELAPSWGSPRCGAPEGLRGQFGGGGEQSSGEDYQAG